MKFLSSTLYGSTLYLVLLLTQLFIISGLSLTALWFYFKRIRNAESSEAILPDYGNEVAGRVTESVIENQNLFMKQDVALVNSDMPMGFTDPLNKLSEVHLDLIKDLEAKVSNLEAEKKNLFGPEKIKMEELQKTNKETEEKIKSLEANLLEFDILKEEIGSLTQLKAENRSFKEEVVKIQEHTSQLESQTKLLEAKIELQRSVESELKSTINAQPLEVSAPQTTQIPMAPEMNIIPKGVENISPSEVLIDASSEESLEELLNEIESLTSEKNGPIRKKA